MKTILISKELYLKKEKIPLKIQNNPYIVLGCNYFKEIQKYKNQKEIHVFDLYNGKRKRNKGLLKVNNHINKTGENPLINNTNKEIQFFDITSIYKTSTSGIIVSCYGEKPVPEDQSADEISTYFLCNYAISAYISKIKKIHAYIVL